MTWLIWSDLHADNWRQFSTILPNGLNSRLMQQIEVVKQIKNIARKHKVETIFFLGDLFNSQSASIDKLLYNTIFYMIQSLAENVQLFLLVGNHDIYRNINIFTPFTSIPNVWVTHDTTQIIHDGVRLDLMPWQSKLPQEKGEFCFGHFGIQGATIGDEFVIDEEISPTVLREYKLVLAGHYHTRQQVAGNAYQVGSVISTSFKDSNEDKGIWLLNPSSSQLQFIPIVSPKFITIHIDTPEQLDNFSKIYSKVNYYRILVSRDDIQVSDIESNMIVEYTYEPTIEEKETIDTTEINNLKPIILEFIEKSNTSLNKGILKEKAIELLEM